MQQYVVSRGEPENMPENINLGENVSARNYWQNFLPTDAASLINTSWVHTEPPVGILSKTTTCNETTSIKAPFNTLIAVYKSDLIIA